MILLIISLSIVQYTLYLSLSLSPALNSKAVQFSRGAGKGETGCRGKLCGCWSSWRFEHDIFGLGALRTTIFSRRQSRLLRFVSKKKNSITHLSLIVMILISMHFISCCIQSKISSASESVRINRNAFKPPVSEYVKDIVRRNFSREVEFYEFCKDRLYKQYRALRLPTGKSNDASTHNTL